MTESSSNALLDKLLKYAKPGCRLKISTKTMGDFVGLLDEIDEKWLVLICNSVPEFIDMSEIIRFSFLQGDNSSTPNREDEQLSSKNEQNPILSKTSSVSGNLPSIHAVEDSQASNSPLSLSTAKQQNENEHFLRLFFGGVPQFAVPQPVFDERLKDNKDFWTLLSPWRNKYGYALKIKEFDRLLPLVNEIKSFADKYSICSDKRLSGYLYYLDGLFLYHGSHSLNESLLLLKKAIECKYIDASMAYGALLIQSKDYNKAARFLAKGIKLCDGVDCKDAIIALGQCVMQLPERKIIPIGEILEAKQLPNEFSESIRKLLSYLIQDDEEASQVVLSGSVEDIRMTRSGNDLFPWEQMEENITDFSGISELSIQPSNNQGYRL